MGGTPWQPGSPGRALCLRDCRRFRSPPPRPPSRRLLCRRAPPALPLSAGPCPPRSPAPRGRDRLGTPASGAGAASGPSSRRPGPRPPQPPASGAAGSCLRPAVTAAASAPGLRGRAVAASAPRSPHGRSRAVAASAPHLSVCLRPGPPPAQTPGPSPRPQRAVLTRVGVRGLVQTIPAGV